MATTIETNDRGQVIITCSDLPIKQYRNEKTFEGKKMIAASAGLKSDSEVKKLYDSLSEEEKVKWLRERLEGNRVTALLKELGYKGITRN